MLTSKEIIETTGISRATLNNYIASGLVQRPAVLPPAPEDGDAPRIGYFPDDTIERIQAIQRMKREGWSIARIAEHLAKGGPVQQAAPDATAAPIEKRPDPTAATPKPVTRETPVLTAMAIVVATLEDAPGLWARLSAQEYFELANEVWAALESIFRLHGGLLGRHPDDGIVCFFLREPAEGHLAASISAARAAREAMRELDRRWHERKHWDVRVAMNFGIDEGEAWMGSIGPDELRVLGEPMERAAQLSRCGPSGAILATRGLLGKLPPDARARLPFAAPNAAAGSGARTPNTFAPLAALCQGAPARLAGVPVAEILEPQMPYPGL